MGKSRGRHGVDSIGMQRSKVLGEAERGIRKQRKQEQQRREAQEDSDSDSVDLESAGQEDEPITMSFNVQLTPGAPVKSAAGSVPCTMFLNNFCMNGSECPGSRAEVVVRWRRNVGGAAGEWNSATLLTLTSESPQAALQGIYFDNSTDLSLELKVAGPSKKAVKVTVVGQQRMQLSERQIARIIR
eukprot:TRINITY_DN47420_c0_g1_i1.p1 TRINITY_DN47420_c0_g1~~TRINITY_DN47420_c0_g1_i1.p1  ORF type:complete len:207 (+),score=78.60 TRINITY_DN47420_c0_g1_i1:65-622(+)